MLPFCFDREFEMTEIRSAVGEGLAMQDYSPAHQFDLLRSRRKTQLKPVRPVKPGAETGLQSPLPARASRSDNGGAFLPNFGTELEPAVEERFRSDIQLFCSGIDGPLSFRRGRSAGDGTLRAVGNIKNRRRDIHRRFGNGGRSRLFLFLLRETRGTRH